MLLDYDVELKSVYSELKSIERWINANRMDSNCRYLISYAVIKSCGTIEKISKNILFDYISIGTNENAMNYFAKVIKESSFNPRFGTLKNKLNDFNKERAKKLSEVIKIEWKEDINSLVLLRNNFAHGQNISSSINDIINYYCNSMKILIYLNIILDEEYENQLVLSTRSYETWNYFEEVNDIKIYKNKMRNITVSVYQNHATYDEKKKFYEVISNNCINFVPKMLDYNEDELSICTECLFGWNVDDYLRFEHELLNKGQLILDLTDMFNQLIGKGFVCQNHKKENILILNDEERNIIINTDEFLYTSEIDCELTAQFIEEKYFNNIV